MPLIKKGLSAPTAASIARALRDFADGFAAILLPVYLATLGFDAAQIGLAATLALLGSAMLTLAVGWIASRFGDRRTLLGAAVLMTLTGVAFAMSSHFWAILLVSLFGTLNPSSGNASLFVPAEQSIMTRGVAAAQRTKTFAMYGLIGALAAAFGSLLTRVPDIISATDGTSGWGFDRLTALRAMFLLYAAIGVAIGVVYAMTAEDKPSGRGEQAGMLGPSRKIVFKLMALFSLDSFAGGFVVQSLLALYLFQRFDMSLTAAGTFFFWSGVLSAFSQPVAAWLAARIGLINTMVFTHIPASVFLILAALSPPQTRATTTVFCPETLSIPKARPVSSRLASSSKARSRKRSSSRRSTGCSRPRPARLA